MLMISKLNFGLIFVVLGLFLFILSYIFPQDPKTTGINRIIAVIVVVVGIIEILLSN